MNEEFKILVKDLEPTLQRLISSPFIDLSNVPTKPKLPGVYVFYEGKTPIYVGRTRNFKSRIRSHHNMTNPNMGSFAFLMACKTYGRIKPAYKKEGGRKDLHSNPKFRPHLKKANERIGKMNVKFVLIEDPKFQHVFEIYAAMSLNTGFNTFDTH